ncbi:MAG: sugar-binding protein [Cyclobacteriaceae bacterium]
MKFEDRSMKRNLICCLILFLLSSLNVVLAQQDYWVKYIAGAEVQVDGTDNDTAWDKATVLTDFVYPWQDEQAPATRFRGLWNNEYFYFLFQVEDGFIHLVDDASLDEEDQAVGSDRVEIFTKNPDNSQPYYSLEMDADGRLFDSKAIFDKKNGIDRTWDWPEGHLVIQSSMDEKGYTVEGKISLASLKALGVLTDGVLHAGLYRGEYVAVKGTGIGVKWISWIIPDSTTPNFHIPSSFGVLRLVK